MNQEIKPFPLLSNRTEKAAILYELSKGHSIEFLMGFYELTRQQYLAYLHEYRKANGLVHKRRRPPAKGHKKIPKPLKRPSEESFLGRFNKLETRKEKGLFLLELRKTNSPRDILLDLDLTRSQYSSFLASLKEKRPMHFLKVLEARIKNFQSKAPITQTVTTEEFINLFGETPICYLTGKVLNIREPKSYVLDHFVPASKGGSGDLENMKPCDPLANIMKWNTRYEDFIKLCKVIYDNADKMKTDDML
jgi:hypothetical protein